ncbi:MAG: phosphoenolpyruvate--protein phosphotransferase [Oscillospiraceae bacterium]|nr:phosphoenolpyruvate--protein phosphotransferase [Oscillospiraceae bacterium]
MKVMKATPASKGIALGQARILGDSFVDAVCVRVEDPRAELARFRKAHDDALEDLKKVYERASGTMDEDTANILQTQMFLLRDKGFLHEITNIISGMKVNAEFAVKMAEERYTRMFSSMENEYMNARCTDIKDICLRLSRLLMGHTVEWTPNRYAQEILIARELMPSETVDLDVSAVSAILTKEGSIMSHSAILARTMNIPSIVGLGSQLDAVNDGDVLIVDGDTGTVYLNPDEATYAQFDKKKEELYETQQRLREYIGKPSVTKDGVKVVIRGNGAVVEDLERIKLNDAEGIGLFRSEFLYMRSTSLPTEEEQFLCYKNILESMDGKPVTIRTLDVGSDKEGSYIQIPPEQNPAMGFRGMRLGLWHRDVYKTQIKALYRASVYGPLSIMFPMISTLDEVLQGKEIIKEVQAELDADGIPYVKDVPVGIMIETPAAALISDILAKHVDFFSVGTNDLTQYVLAADRMNSRLSYLYEDIHVAVLRLIKFSADCIHREGKKISVCGEMGSQRSMTAMLLALGVDELSVNPAAVLEIRETICNLDMREAKEQADKLLGMK